VSLVRSLGGRQGHGKTGESREHGHRDGSWESHINHMALMRHRKEDDSDADHQLVCNGIQEGSKLHVERRMSGRIRGEAHERVCFWLTCVDKGGRARWC